MKLKPQLFCFSYAGGNASFFDEIERMLPEADVVKLEYAGHGTRHKEPLAHSVPELAEDLYDRLKNAYAGGEYALFGYSMGTICATEVLRRILERGELPAPRCVFLAAHEPHTKAILADFSSGEKDEAVKERTIRFGAVPDRLIHNRSFWRVYLPILRADYSLIGQYCFERLDLKTVIPAVIFYSETDTPFSEMERWRDIFIGACDFFRFNGGHFFIRDHCSRMVEIMKEKLSRSYHDDL